MFIHPPYTFIKIHFKIRSDTSVRFNFCTVSEQMLVRVRILAITYL